MLKHPSLMPFKSKAQRVVVAFIGSVIAIAIVIMLFGDATDAARKLFSHF